VDLDHAACYRALRTRDARFDGRLFVGVTSTGIYCRPVCPARTPRREHVRFFRSAAAAQSAGFRPCLRCRPESAPDFAAWRGTSNTVSRALAMIETGALDEGDVDGLAARLGVGERHLRRLFRAHLGAPPIAVAQTRRVLLAKQLIHETRLPMAEVALAAGFGSIRRFNETFQRLFGRSPVALRRGVDRDVRAPQDVIALRLPFRPPYDWDAMLAFLAARAIPGVEMVEHGRYARTIQLDGGHGFVIVRPGGRNALEAAIRIPVLTALPVVVSRLRRVFDLAADPGAIASHLSDDPRLTPLVTARPGLRVPGAWDGFELAVRAVLGQQITVAGGGRLAGALVGLCGEPLSRALGAPAALSHVFPTAVRVAAADLSQLRMPRARSTALSSLAAAVVADPLLFDPRRDLKDAVAHLSALPGVGEWTAQYIAMRELREPDAFPAADAGLLRAMTDGDGRPTPQALLARAERWRPWRAYAAMHLWTSLAGSQGVRGSASRAHLPESPLPKGTPSSRPPSRRGQAEVAAGLR
jgi:AraC family transcriptional regulator of adaptative response / DNA-3-methyladenine glycosylase II